MKPVSSNCSAHRISGTPRSLVSKHRNPEPRTQNPDPNATRPQEHHLRFPPESVPTLADIDDRVV
eukprot:1138924-Rhodomonas_salina.3